MREKQHRYSLSNSSRMRTDGGGNAKNRCSLEGLSIDDKHTGQQAKDML